MPVAVEITHLHGAEVLQQRPNHSIILKTERECKSRLRSDAGKKPKNVIQIYKTNCDFLCALFHCSSYDCVGLSTALT